MRKMTQIVTIYPLLNLPVWHAFVGSQHKLAVVAIILHAASEHHVINIIYEKMNKKGTGIWIIVAQIAIDR
jgi:hypothetical protein